MPSLAGSHEKLRRAHEQLVALEELFGSFIERQEQVFTTEFERHEGKATGDCVFRISRIAEPPAVWGVLIGEAVHNLRSSLDHLAWALAHRPWRKTQFPMFMRAEDAWSREALSMVKGIPAKYVALMERAQPYNAKGPPVEHVLAVLNHLSNHDKHRLLHTTILSIDTAAPEFVAGQGVAGIEAIALHFGELQDGAEVARVTILANDPAPVMEMKGEFALHVAFADTSSRGQPVNGEPVIHVLVEILKYVRWLVRNFEDA